MLLGLICSKNVTYLLHSVVRDIRAKWRKGAHDRFVVGIYNPAGHAKNLNHRQVVLIFVAQTWKRNCKIFEMSNSLIVCS